ncbi:MAG: hypothetical protein RSG59_04145 [Ruthenibacterium sp.]
MTAFFQIMISFAAVAVLAAFVARRTKLPSALAPLPVLCGVMVFTVLCGYLGLLPLAVWTLYALAAAALLSMLITAKKGGFRALLTPGFVLFCVCGVACLALLAARKPVPQGWDEFSLWATAAKLTKSSNGIFSAAASGYPWPNTQKPGLPTLSYFFNFFGEYAAWRMYAAYDLLMISVWAAAVGSLRWRDWKIVVPTSLAMFLLQYLPVYTRNIYCDFSYITSYADYPMAILTMGVLAWYYHVSRLYKQREAGKNLLCTSGKRLAGMALPLAVMSAAVTLCKDTGLPLACIAAMVVGVDLLLAGGEEHPAKWRAWLPKISVPGAMFAGAGAIFLASSKFLNSLGAAQGSVGGDSDMGYATLLVEGTKQLFGLPAGAAGAPYVEKFAAIKAEMISLFLPAAGGGNNVTMLGCGLFVMLLVWLLCAATALLCTDKLHRRSAVLYGVFSTLGFWAYYIFIGFTYVYVFKKDGTASIIDYNRYINTYYMLWVGTAVVLLALGAALGSRLKNSLTLGTLVLSTAFLVRFTQLVQPQLCVLAYPDAVYADVAAVHTRAAAVKAQLAPGDKVFYVNDGDNGLGWFRNHYELLPENILMYSNGGGVFGDPRYFESVDAAAYLERQNPVIPREEFAAYLVRHDCKYVYLDDAYSEFYESYRALLSDGGQENYQGRTILYKVNVTGTPVYADMEPADTVYPWEVDANGTVAPNKNYETRVKMVNATDCVRLTPVEMEVPNP